MNNVACLQQVFPPLWCCLFLTQQRCFTQEPQKERTCCSCPFWTVFILFRNVTTVTTSMTRGDNLSQYSKWMSLIILLLVLVL